MAKREAATVIKGGGFPMTRDGTHAMEASMNASALAKGRRIYYHGDMANRDHFGTITEVRTDSWGTHYTIAPDPPKHQDDREKPYKIDAVMFSPVYLGHGGTRFVTEEAYNAYRKERIAALEASMKAAK